MTEEDKELLVALFIFSIPAIMLICYNWIIEPVMFERCMYKTRSIESCNYLMFYKEQETWKPEKHF